MRVLIIGAGRMGIQHALGAGTIDAVNEICLSDISENALAKAADAVAAVSRPERFRFVNSDGLAGLDSRYDIAIIASTAGARLDTIRAALGKGARYILLEKPLGQSIQQVEEIAAFFKHSHPDTRVYVNLSMRLNPSLIELKEDLDTFPQMQGPKTITINTGAIGIGANGIHLMDSIFFILGAEKAIVIAAEVENIIIPSGRGAQFGDFGGWAVIKFYKQDQYLAKALISIAPDCSPFGAMNIVGPNGYILYDEVRSTRTDTLRKADSKLPVYRYHADYMPDQKKEIASLSLPELTRLWLESIIKEKEVLPTIDETLKVHRLMFDWLSRSTTHTNVFPIT